MAFPSHGLFCVRYLQLGLEALRLLLTSFLLPVNPACLPPTLAIRLTLSNSIEDTIAATPPSYSSTFGFAHAAQKGVWVHSQAPEPPPMPDSCSRGSTNPRTASSNPALVDCLHERMEEMAHAIRGREQGRVKAGIGVKNTTPSISGGIDGLQQSDPSDLSVSPLWLSGSAREPILIDCTAVSRLRPFSSLVSPEPAIPGTH